MKAALCLEQDQPLSVEEVTPIDPGPADVIVRITASGVCHSDLSVINGTLPAGRVVLGHEGTGVIEKRTVVRDDAIAIRTMAYFALSFDHRIVDGSDADRFMAQMKKGLQEFDESAL